MESEYVKENSIIDKTEEEKKNELIKSIILTKEKLLQAHNNFEYADKDLIDYYTYKIKANQAKLNYLIKQAKAWGIMINEVRMKRNFLKIFQLHLKDS